MNKKTGIGMIVVLGSILSVSANAQEEGAARAPRTREPHKIKKLVESTQILIPSNSSLLDLRCKLVFDAAVDGYAHSKLYADYLETSRQSYAKQAAEETKNGDKAQKAAQISKIFKQFTKDISKVELAQIQLIHAGSVDDATAKYLTSLFKKQIGTVNEGLKPALMSTANAGAPSPESQMVRSIVLADDGTLTIKAGDLSYQIPLLKKDEAPKAVATGETYMDNSGEFHPVLIAAKTQAFSLKEPTLDDFLTKSVDKPSVNPMNAIVDAALSKNGCDNLAKLGQRALTETAVTDNAAAPQKTEAPKAAPAAARIELNYTPVSGSANGG